MERLFKYGIILWIFLLSNLGNISAKTIIVTKSGKINSVRKGIALASNGDTLLIHKGIYREGAIKLNKRITIIGEDFPIIDGENKYENLLVEHDNVYIKGLKFINSGSSSFNDIAALKVQNAKYFTIVGNKFENNFFAIHCMNSSFGRIINNKIVSQKSKTKPSANGIHCWKSNHLTIEYNYITGHRDGIYFEFVTNSLIENNKSIKNLRYGLHFMFSHDDTYRNNTIKGNGAGVAVMFSKRVKMYQNTFSENWGSSAYGLLLKEIKDSHIENNHFLDNTTAIFAEGSDRTTIINNEFLRNGWAMKIQSNCNDFHIAKNNFIGNTFDIGTNGSLASNKFEANYWDKYEGYDLNRDGIGDIPYRPITFYAIIIERNPSVMMLFRSFFVKLMDKAESAFPTLTTENLQDMKPEIYRIKF